MKRKYILLGHMAFWFLFLLKEVLQYRANNGDASAYKMLMISTVYLFVTLTAFYGGYRLIYKHIVRPWPRLGWIGAAHIITTLFLIVMARYVVEFGFLKPLFSYDNYAMNQHFTWGWFIQNAVMYYWSWVLYGIMYGFVENYVQQQQRYRERMKAEVSLLRAQVNPHFLFNTLNDIYALALTRPDQTPDALMKLSDLLRYMLYSSQAVSVPLADEIEYVKSYIDLEQIGQKGLVNVQTSFTGLVNGQRIAPMLLIPFVENAFKHGALFETNQSILIDLNVAPNYLSFQCHNAKRTGAKDKTGGIGLTNLRRRLDLEYPDRHTLRIDDTDTVFDVNLRVLF